MPLTLNEIVDMNVQELYEQLNKSRIELTTLRMKFASRQLDDVSQIRKTRKEIAKILTILTRKLKDEVTKGGKPHKIVQHIIPKGTMKEDKLEKKVKTKIKETKKVVASKELKQKEEVVKKVVKPKKEVKKKEK